MEFFDLPPTTKVNRVIPKNAFDSYTTAKQKKLFAEFIAKITWVNKLTPDTLNLTTKDINEIQVFHIGLKRQVDIKSILDIIDKAIPYHIIFIVSYGDQLYISTSVKHPNPQNENNAVIDWTFRSGWFPKSENNYTLRLKKNIDAVYIDFCLQLTGISFQKSPSKQDVITYVKKVDALEKEIAKLKAEIVGCKQFNQKVDLNMKLKGKEKDLQLLRSSA